MSCKTEEFCNDPVEAFVNIGFYTYLEGVETEVSFDDFTAFGTNDGGDSLYILADNVSKISLPLSPLADESAFILTFMIPGTNIVQGSVPVIDSIIFEPEPDTIWTDSVFVDTIPIMNPLNDTLTFTYERELTMLSKECGFTYYFLLHDIQMTGNAIRSSAILEPEIQISDEESIKIFF